MEAFAQFLPNKGDEDAVQPMTEEELMENIKVTYDVFVQHSLDTTSHTIEWINHPH
jgi:hypothetical protein